MTLIQIGGVFILSLVMVFIWLETMSVINTIMIPKSVKVFIMSVVAIIPALITLGVWMIVP